MKKLKVVTIVGTRPEIIRLSRLIPKLDEHTDHVLVHTGQNYDRQLNEVFFEELELRNPDYYLNVDTSSLGSVLGDTLKKTEEVLVKENPDAVMILGDTNSAIAAVVAERMHIPVYHMEAGNRSFDANVPEELNRKMVDHVASFNLPYSEHSRRNLLAEGLHPRFVYKTGSPLREVFQHFETKIQASEILSQLGLDARSYFLVSIHRQENVDSPDRLQAILDSLNSLWAEWQLPILVSTHPRTKKRLDELGRGPSEGIRFHAPFGYMDYNKLQLSAKCVLSDSGSISEESVVAGFPAVSVRDYSERFEALELGSVVNSGITAQGLSLAVKRAVQIEGSVFCPSDYADPNFSDRVLGCLFSTADRFESMKSLKRLPKK